MMPEHENRQPDWLDALAELDTKTLTRPFQAVRKFLQKITPTDGAPQAVDLNPRSVQKALNDIPVQKRKSIIELLESGADDAQALAKLMREAQSGQVSMATLLNLPPVAPASVPSPTELLAQLSKSRNETDEANPTPAPVQTVESAPEAGIPMEFLNEAKTTIEYYKNTALKYLQEHLQKAAGHLQNQAQKQIEREYCSGVEKLMEVIRTLPVEIEYLDPQGTIHLIEANAQGNQRIRISNARSDSQLNLSRNHEGMTGNDVILLPLQRIDELWAAITLISNTATIDRTATPNNQAVFAMTVVDQSLLIADNIALQYQKIFSMTRPGRASATLQDVDAAVTSESFVKHVMSSDLHKPPPSSQAEALLRLKILTFDMYFKALIEAEAGANEHSLHNASQLMSRQFVAITKAAERWFAESEKQRQANKTHAPEPLPQEDSETDWPKEYLTLDETFQFTTALWPQIAKAFEGYDPPKNPKDYNARWEPRGILFELKYAMPDAGLWHAGDKNKVVNMDTYLNGMPAYVMVLHPETPPPRVSDGNHVCATVLEPANAQQRESVHVTMDALPRQAQKPITQTWQNISYVGALVDMKQTCEEAEARTVHMPINDKETHRKAEWWMLRKTFAQMLAADTLSKNASGKESYLQLKFDVKHTSGQILESGDSGFMTVFANMIVKNPRGFWDLIRVRQKGLDIDDVTNDAELYERIMFELRSICAAPAFTLDAEAMRAETAVDNTIALYKELAVTHNTSLGQAIEKVLAEAKKEIATRKGQVPRTKNQEPKGEEPNNKKEIPENNENNEYLSMDETFALLTGAWPAYDAALASQPAMEPKGNSPTYEELCFPPDIVRNTHGLALTKKIWNMKLRNDAGEPMNILKPRTETVGAAIAIYGPAADLPAHCPKRRQFHIDYAPAIQHEPEYVRMLFKALPPNSEQRPTSTWLQLSFTGAMIDLHQSWIEESARDALTGTNNKREWFLLRKTLGMMYAADAMSNNLYTSQTLRITNPQGRNVDDTDADFSEVLGHLLGTAPEQFWEMMQLRQKHIGIEDAVLDSELYERIVFEIRALCASCAYTLQLGAIQPALAVQALQKLQAVLQDRYGMSIEDAVEKVFAAAKQAIAARVPQAKSPSTPTANASTAPKNPATTPPAAPPPAPLTPAQKPTPPKSELERALEGNDKLGAPTLAKQMLFGAIIYAKRLERPEAAVDANAIWENVKQATGKETRTDLGSFALRCTELCRELETEFTTNPPTPSENWQADVRNATRKIVNAFMNDKTLRKWNVPPADRSAAFSLFCANIMRLSETLQARLVPRQSGINQVQQAVCYTLMRDICRQHAALAPALARVAQQTRKHFHNPPAHWGDIRWNETQFSAERFRGIQSLYGTAVGDACSSFPVDPTRETEQLQTARNVLRIATPGTASAGANRLYKECLRMHTLYTVRNKYGSLSIRSCAAIVRQNHLEHVDERNVQLLVDCAFWPEIDALSQAHEVLPRIPEPMHPTQEEKDIRQDITNRVPQLHQRMMDIIRLQCPMLLAHPELLDLLHITEASGGISIDCPAHRADALAHILGQPGNPHPYVNPSTPEEPNSQCTFALPDIGNKMRALGWEVRDPLPKEKLPKADDDDSAPGTPKEHNEGPPQVPGLEPAISDRLHLFLGMLLKHGQQVWAHPEHQVRPSEGQCFPEISVLEGSRILIVCPTIGTSFILTSGGGHLYSIPGVITPEQAMRLSPMELRRYYTTLTKEDAQAVTSIDTVLNTCKEANPGLLPLGREYFVEELRTGTDRALDALIIDLERVAKTSGKTVEQLNTTDFSDISSGEMHFKLGGVCHGSTFLKRAYKALSQDNEHAGELVPQKKLSSTLAVLKTMALQRKRMQDVLRDT